jgi:hypothetical protein
MQAKKFWKLGIMNMQWQIQDLSSIFIKQYSLPYFQNPNTMSNVPNWVTIVLKYVKDIFNLPIE